MLLKILTTRKNFLKKNDVVFVDRNSESIHVFGEVSKPGTFIPASILV